MDKKNIFGTQNLFVFFFAIICLSALPRHMLIERVCSSPIKAIVEVDTIEDIDYNPDDYYHRKKATFRMNQCFQNCGNELHLIGYFYVINEKYNGTGMPGGPNSYSNIKKGDIAFITLDGSNELTSYTIVTPEIREALIHNPDRIGVLHQSIYILKENEIKEPYYYIFKLNFK